ncbi:MAG: leucine-rich repeat protein [Bacilli bacterium]|nr:leucine-rich repeat protein [Bacilli bacterium]MDD4282402.1 leucine-rich repeat protein [Bacilli bacterium]
MQGKKGFTLIELLAVIIILGLVMVIVVPAVNNAIEKSQKKTSINSAQGLVRSVNIVQGEYIIDNPIKELIFTYTDGVETSNVPGLKLDYSGKKPKNGNIIVNENGKVSLVLHDGKYCVEKDFDDEEYEVTKKPIEECGDILKQETDIACFEVESMDHLFGGETPPELEGTLAITKYDFENCPSDIVIPNQINNVDIAVIGPAAFSYCYYGMMSDEYMCELDPENPGLPYNPYPITSVVLPNELFTVYEGAFALNNLTNVIIPSSVVEIADMSFMSNQLTNVIIPASIESLDEYTFFCNPMLNPTFEGDPFPLIFSCEHEWQ